ncbi:enoyl-CoA hydratase [Knoellia locipacati]|uniref:Putative enoyl-CoA hydratase echA6 n=1 Tax=Knoellia locipacati TaxID=882824 RepID=A0A512T3R2_9MICO|nr:enoyl-CoA hydratase-related protein [Knoellia locipacati]GEQ14842.1 putative enoyl-CoA hydratase echA6 [Knoellia locipacati]
MISSRTTDRVTVLTLDRPERRNALNHDALDELEAGIVDAVAQSRALVVTGAAGHFCAGADLTELEDVSFTDRLAEVLDLLSRAPITTVAAISGSCMGLGMQLAVACDLRVVTDDAAFAVPVARLGLMVNHWTLERVTRFWGEGAARHMVLTGAVLTADDAWRLGFTQVRGDLDAALELARRAVDLAPLTQAGSKLGFDTHGGDHADVARYEAAFATAWSSDDLSEGRSAFRERRTPEFQGR